MASGKFAKALVTPENLVYWLLSSRGVSWIPVRTPTMSCCACHVVSPFSSAYGIAIFFKNLIHERYFESLHDVFERSVYTCVVPKNGDKCQRVIGSVINHRVVLDAFFDKSVVDSRLRFGFSSIGIDVGHTHGHAQTNGIGELFPCFYIAADFVVLSQNLINGKYLDVLRK